MRSFVLAAAAIVLSGLPAQAEAWKGPYLGAQLGDTFGDASQPYGAVGGPFVSSQRGVKFSSVNAGAHIGYDHPFEEFVVGALVDYNFASLEGDDAGSGGDLNGVEIDEIITLRARGGWRFSAGSMVYATAGGAWMQGEATAPLQRVDADFSGYTYGLGVEFTVGENATIGFEWRRFEFDRERVSFPLEGYDEGIDPEIDTVQIHLNYYLSDLMP